jgi:hypothetical protein
MVPHVTDHEAVNGDGMHIDPPDAVLARTSV